MRSLIFSILSLCVFNSAQAQIPKKAAKHFNQAITEYRGNNFQKAIDEIDKAVEKYPNFAKAYILRAEIGLTTKNLTLAIESYELAIDNLDVPSPSIYLSLGKAELHEGLYDDALGTFTTMLKEYQLEPKLKSIVMPLFERAKFSSHAVKNPVPFNPQNLGPKVNTIEDEYHPSLSLDGKTLIVTRKDKVGNNRYGKPLYKEDFYFSELKSDQWTPFKNLGKPLNTRDNEGAQSMSMDGRYMYFTACHRHDGIGSCDLYRSKKSEEGWGEAENLGKPLNAAAWDSQPYITSNNQNLYFISARTGGKGEKDIWLSKKNDDGEWMSPESLPFNTKGNELTPFIHPDGKTLYFASDYLPGMGGFDIFYIRKNDDGEWGEPVNLGFPINTLGDEYGLIVTPLGDLAFYSSNRMDGIGGLDIYYFDLYKEARPTAVLHVKGKTYDQKTKGGLETNIEIIELQTEDVVASATSEIGSGLYMAALPIDKDYAVNVSADGYLFYSENFSLKGLGITQTEFRLDVPLDKMEVGNKVVLKNIFFGTGSFELKNESKAELNKLVSFLVKNKTMSIEIGGHTDNVGAPETNQKLSEARAKSVYTYLIENGIETIRLSFKGFGQDLPIESNDTDQGRANNRRTEFKVVGV